MWPTVAKFVLIAFLVLAAVVIVAVFIRNSRAKGFPTQESSSHFNQARGAMPPMPRPDWAKDRSQDAEPDDTR
jgi:preprotein translocase subunit SecG